MMGLLIKSKSGSYNFFYAILTLAVLFSFIAAAASNGKSELTPLAANGNISTYFALLSPILVIVLFYDAISSKIVDGTLKKILSEPVSRRTLKYGSIFLVVAFSFVYSFLLVTPGAILSYFIAHNPDPVSFTRYFSLLFPTFIYVLFFSSATFLITSSVSRTSSSILISLLVLAFCYLLWIPLSDLLNYSIINHLLGIGSNSPLALTLANEESYFIPTQGYNNSVVPLGYPMVKAFSFRNVFVYSFNGAGSTLLHSLEISLIFMLPTLIYSIIIMSVMTWSMGNLKRHY
jgi:ABC-type transport system involved in multi-copper enzyme maturation permease subunit